MPRIPTEVLKEIEAALDRYEADVQAAPLTPATRKTYLLHARNFVRWLGDDFTPGGRAGG
jgi:hypothetical protein